MASSSRGLDNCIQELQRRTLNQLKSIAKHEGIPSSGTKRTLQDRIRARLDDYFQKSNDTQLSRLKALIADPTASTSSNNVTAAPSPNARAVNPHTMFNGIFSSSQPAMNRNASHPSSAANRLTFKDSPFYTILRSLGPVKDCPAQEGTRGVVTCSIQLPGDVVSSILPPGIDRDLRVMVFCTADPPTMHSRAEISFPTQVDIKVNSVEVRANFRGLKNKPGSTRPADITDLVAKNPRSRSDMVVSYALTNKPFFFVVNLVREQTCEALVSKLVRSKCISKEQVLSEMRGRAKDTDIEATSTTMSLKCPLSTLRMDIPCRSAVCSHNQCFDALSFIQLQQQAPTWNCPVCNKSTPFSLLQVDKYVSSILESTPASTEQVMVEPDGTWSMMPGSPALRRHAMQASGVDEDLVEISEFAPRKHGPLPTPSSGTPNTSSREPSITGTAKSSGSKRTHSVTIDLTLSSDDETPREVKKQALLPRHTQEPLARRPGAGVRLEPPQRPLTVQDPSPSYGRPQEGFDFSFPR